MFPQRGQRAGSRSPSLLKYSKYVPQMVFAKTIWFLRLLLSLLKTVFDHGAVEAERPVDTRGSGALSDKQTYECALILLGAVAQVGLDLMPVPRNSANAPAP